MAASVLTQIMEMLFSLVRSLFGSKADLAMELLALRQRLAVHKRKQPWPHIDPFDRLFWSVLKDQFAGWMDALVIVKPDTVVKWQKRRFQDFWAMKSKPGRPCIPRQHIAFIRRISGETTSLRPAAGASKAKPPRLRRGPHRARAGEQVRNHILRGHGPHSLHRHFRHPQAPRSRVG